MIAAVGCVEGDWVVDVVDTWRGLVGVGGCSRARQRWEEEMEARGNDNGSSKEDVLIQSEDTGTLDYDWDQIVGDLDRCRQIGDDNISGTNVINLDNHND
ncbi:uncharacterized protein A4U43_C04F720 [Asparagus officinalis]|uniref:Uncharacterized protein n=1 Tax=Asparagus officinalis TaxID=4686 RepID=A0A5P1F2Q1_ASPOF|nr:uncharacterized protein A4U43_C04F720 [Asparagus officinalis]